MVTVSTAGHSPALAGWLRGQLAAQLGPEVGLLAELLSEARDQLKAAGRSTEEVDWRPALDSDMLELIRSGRTAQARERLQACLSSSSDSTTAPSRFGCSKPMTVPPARAAKALHDLAGRDHLSEAVVVSTCLRTEVYAVAERFHGAMSDIRNFLSAWSGIPPEAFSDHLYSYYDEAAAAHLFKVAAGLDSAVLGESEILGQVGDAWDAARAGVGRRAGAVDAVPPRRRGRQAGPLRDGHRPRHDVAVAGRGGPGVAELGIAGGQDHPRARRRRDGREAWPRPWPAPWRPGRCSSPTARGARPPSWPPAAAAGPSSGRPCRPPWSRPTCC